MTTAAQEREAERVFLEQLRARFESDGFDFQLYPTADVLPEFFGRYKPDAVAIKGDQRIAIEVKGRRTASAEDSLRQIRKVFVGHPDWQFRVIFRGIDPQEAITVTTSAPDVIRNRVAKTRELQDQKERWIAFVSAWSLLEAAFRSAGDAPSDGRPYRPDTVVQTLGMNGRITPEREHQLRDLLKLRSRIVHGDLAAEPTDHQLELVLSTIDEVLKETV